MHAGRGSSNGLRLRPKPRWHSNLRQVGPRAISTVSDKLLGAAPRAGLTQTKGDSQHG